MLGENVFPIDYGVGQIEGVNELAGRIKTSASNSVNYLFRLSSAWLVQHRAHVSK